MDFKANAKSIKQSARKLRLLADALRGKLAIEAVEKLKFLDKASARPMLKLIQSAMANAKDKADVNKLIISTLFVDEGPRYKRQDKSHGARFARGIIHRPTSNIKIILSLKEESASVLPIKQTTARLKNGKKS